MKGSDLLSRGAITEEGEETYRGMCSVERGRLDEGISLLTCEKKRTP